MTTEEAIDKLTVVAATSSDDQECAHSYADHILLAYLDSIAPEVAKAWRNVNTSCGGFWYA